MDAVKILPHYTYDDYLHWEGKWEVIDGIPYAMSPALLPNHQIIAVRLSAEFLNQLKQCRKCQVYQPIDYIIADDSILQPDMLIVCGEIKKKFLDFAPALVTEILSPSTALKDRYTKFAIYQSKGIKYYLIIDPDNKEAEVYKLDDAVYSLQQKGNSFAYEFLIEDCKAIVNFGEIW